MPKVLITGYKGFVGQYFCRKYAWKGWEVSGVDIADGVDIRDFFKEDSTRYDLVIHLAAVVGGRATIDGDPLKVAVDLSIDAEMANWALRTKPGRIVYFSSSAAYPIKYQRDVVNGIELSEHMIDFNDLSIGTPDMTYGWAKLTGEFLMKFLRKEGIPVSIFRPFSGYGTDQSLDYPFPSFIKRALDKADPFEIWGTGEQVRDFIHIRDIVDAVTIAVDKEIDGPVNLGSGVGTSFNELAELVCKIAKYEPEFLHREAAPVGVMYRVADVTQMSSFYQPSISLEEGIEMALRGIK
jgi:nucleoside-diphosphate-sugar epimerase